MEGKGAGPDRSDPDLLKVGNGDRGVLETWSHKNISLQFSASFFYFVSGPLGIVDVNWRRRRRKQGTVLRDVRRKYLGILNNDQQMALIEVPSLVSFIFWPQDYATFVTSTIREHNKILYEITVFK